MRLSPRAFLQMFGIVSLSAVCAVIGLAQSGPPQIQTQRSGHSSPAGPTFVVRETDLQKPTTVIAYGDMRFTDPGTLAATNTSARRALVARVAQERPDAVLLNGDLTMHGGDQADYAIYEAETKAWRDAHLRIFPALGNHEFANCEVRQCLQNWWKTFPELRDRRWYSVQLGTKVYVFALDSNDSLLPGSPQQSWLKAQITSLPKNFKFVFITMHHEPVGDIQVGADDNPRPNEKALADLLKRENVKSRARFVVVAGHIHNYERFEQDGVSYLVSGGGGAPQQVIERTLNDLYQDKSFPNFHYVKFVLDGDTVNATMYRLADPNGPVWEAKDTFKVEAKPARSSRVHKP
jgi:3',5'-cyclic AMP phosphodiesterase CpdA